MRESSFGSWVSEIRRIWRERGEAKFDDVASVAQSIGSDITRSLYQKAVAVWVMSRVFYSFPWPRAARCWRDVQRSNAACLSSRSLPFTLVSLLLVLSFLIPMFIHSVYLAFSAPPSPAPPSLSLSLSFFLSLSYILVALSCIHPLCSPTDCQNHPSDETQTVLPNVCATRSLAICISFVLRHRIFRERVLSGDFRSSCRVAEAGANPVCVANLRHRSSLQLCRESSIGC